MSDLIAGWEVSVPDRASGPARSRRATLTIELASGERESLRVPVAVGRRLRDAAAPATRRELDALVDEVSLSCARARLADLLGRRDYTTRELAGRLADDGYRDEPARRAVSWARSCGLVDDARYGAAFARSKALCGWGRLKVERELERRGVSVEEIDGWPEEYFPGDDERARALALASRRRLTGKNDFQKIARFLCGRGFPYAVAADVAREVCGAGSD